MSELRAIALERYGSGLEATQADAEMEAERFRLVHHVNTRFGDRAVNVRIYERRPPTAEERLEEIVYVGDELAAYLDRIEKRDGGGERARYLAKTWREAVEKTEKA